MDEPQVPKPDPSESHTSKVMLQSRAAPLLPSLPGMTPIGILGHQTPCCPELACPPLLSYCCLASACRVCMQEYMDAAAGKVNCPSCPKALTVDMSGAAPVSSCFSCDAQACRHSSRGLLLDTVGV